MTELLVVLVLSLVVIAAAALVGPRLGIAAPLVLVGIGVVASLLPVFGSAHVDPEWILEGVLPPLLYSAAVSMPAMNFRREFAAISGLSVLLVVASALVLGLFFTLAVPGLDLAWAVALGAIVSPTDAVATSIIKQTSVSKRVVAILDGESLLNDATALVLLGTATLAADRAFSAWGTLGTFAYSVAVAVLIGWAVGSLDLVVRRRISDPTVNTVLSFTVPFVASVPAGLLGASGLVAAVVAGLVTGVFAPRYFSPQNRLSDTQNWRTVELVLEGAVFLTMGLQIKSIVLDVQRDHAGVAATVLVAAGAWALTLLVRAAYVVPLLALLRGVFHHGLAMEDRLLDMQTTLDTEEGRQEAFEQLNRRRRPASQRQLDRFAKRVRQVLADLDYLRREPLGRREATVVVWAGMRGAVTVAAAQTLDDGTPQRSVLVLVAFAVATLSLLVQGGTIGPLLRLLRPAVDPAVAAEVAAERARLRDLMRTAAEGVTETRPERPEGEPTREQYLVARRYRLAVIAAQRSTVLDARDYGTFDADVLADALATLDATQIALESGGSLAG